MDFVIGLLVGALLFWLFFERRKPSGTFIIDMSDPMQDEMFRLVWDESLNEISLKNKIVLDVKVIEEGENSLK